MSRGPAMTWNDRKERHRRVAAMYAEGAHRDEVAARFGIHPGHVSKIAKLYGVSRPQGRPLGFKVAR